MIEIFLGIYFSIFRSEPTLFHYRVRRGTDQARRVTMANLNFLKYSLKHCNRYFSRNLLQYISPLGILHLSIAFVEQLIGLFTRRVNSKTELSLIFLEAL